MRNFPTRRISSFGIANAVILVLVCLSGAAPAMAQQDNSYQLYQTISRTFWNAEHQLQQRVDPFSATPSPYLSPLPKSDPLYQKYFQVDQAANQYLQILDNRQKSPFSEEAPQQNSPLLKGDSGGFSGQSWTLPPALYLGGIAAFTIGDYANAQKYFSRLLQNHANYKRYSYIGDNYTPNPDFAQPVKPAVTKLLFYCQAGARRRARFRCVCRLQAIQPNLAKSTFLTSCLCKLACQSSLSFPTARISRR
jgi:hypothetical protein